jgi:hypothetical protein
MRLHLLRYIPSASVLGLAAAALHGGCSPDSGVVAPPAQGETSGGGEFDFDAGVFDDASDALPDPDAACATVTEEAISVPVNLYVLMDKSTSMDGDKWTSAKAGLTAFVRDPRFAGLRVALRFFPRPVDAVPACDQFAYKEPVVPFNPLPDNAEVIVQALEGELPDGRSTPIYAALGGAILKGIEEAEARPGEASAVLLVTDGQPQGPAPLCGGVNPEDPAVIAGLATRGASHDPPVRTYVIGLEGVDQSFANQVAAAGGTDSAVLVGATNVAVEFQRALAKVTGEALSCEYEVPSRVAGGEISFSEVNVLFALDGAPEAILPQRADCAGPGWRYDDPTSPTRILLCPATCSAARDASSAKLQILLGCETVIR